MCRLNVGGYTVRTHVVLPFSDVADTYQGCVVFDHTTMVALVTG